MKHFFVINPVAGKNKGKSEIERLVEDLAKKYSLDVEFHFTLSKDDARIFTKHKCEEFAHEDKIRFYACGGDGTLNEVINGCVEFDNVEVANFPCGTGNDFLSVFENKKDFLDMEALILGDVFPVDILKLTMYQGSTQSIKYAVNTVSIGFDSNIAFEMNKFRKVPFLKGNSVYYAALLYCLMKRLSTPLAIRIKNQDKLKNEFLLMVIGNGREYGGGFKALPMAKIDDGLMDFCAVKRVSRAKILSLVKEYQKGTHISNEKMKDLVVYKQAESVIVKGVLPIKLAYDGECVECEKLKVSILPQKLQFIIPNKNKINKGIEYHEDN